MFVIYTSSNEAIVTTVEQEHLTLKEYFGNPDDRDVDDYDRTEGKDCAVSFLSGIKIEWA